MTLFDTEIVPRLIHWAYWALWTLVVMYLSHHVGFTRGWSKGFGDGLTSMERIGKALGVERDDS